MSFLKRSKWTLAIAGAVIAGGAAHAAPTFSSSANAATVRLGPIAYVSVDGVSGTGGSYSNSGSVLSVNQAANVAGLLSERVSAGVGPESATSNGTTQAKGSVTLAAPTIGLDTTVPLPLGGSIITTLFGISADAITSSSTVTNMGGVLTAVGLSSITNLNFSGLAAPLASLVGSLSINPAANTSVSIGNALTLTLNEQIQTASAGALALETNALHLSLLNYSIGGTSLTGDFILGHSAASISGVTAAVPEPASWAMMIAGFGLVGATLRASRRTARTVMA